LSVLLLLDCLGTLAFALSGALKAARSRCDVFGLVVLAIVTAVGGGTLRDVLLGAHPIFWLAQPGYLLLALLPALLVFLWSRPMARTEQPLAYADAVGLGVFTVIGASKALDHHAGWAGAIVCGCLTGVGGGVLRDLLVREVPFVLQKEVYASATIAGSGLFCILRYVHAPEWLALVGGAALVIVIRTFCIAGGYHLPQPDPPDEPPAAPTPLA
jgi:uncharacterized membrane protein YeiH